ncbi:S8 family serine peptidase [bacterium]|nr:S8 family serine peptidase [bacterium]
MKVKLIIISIILLLIMVFACGCIPFMENIGLINPTDEEQLSPEKASPDGLVKVLIGFKDKPGPPEQALVKGVGGKIKYTYHIVDAIAASIPEASIAGLKANPNVTYLEMDGLVYALDDELDNSWGVKRIGAGVVHDSGNNGGGIIIAVIDTGIDKDHPDLDGNLVGGVNFVSNPPWKDPDPNKWDDDNGHGTHVAGIIAAEDNDTGVVGVAPEAALYALKVLDRTGSGYVSAVVAAIEWATVNDIQVINMSLGGGDHLTLDAACSSAYDDGLILVASAGNGGAVSYPAAYLSVIAVSATDSSDNLASFSSTGNEVELAAPGVDIYSTYKDGGYATMSGTSMASPHVAGTAALVWIAYPSWTNDDVRTQLQNTADDLGDAGWDPKYGYGLVDADEAAPQSTDTTPPAKVTGLTVITIVSCAQLDLVWDANTETDLDHYNVYRSNTSGSLYDLIASPTTNSYSDTGLTASTIYYYVVSAVDTSGNEGEKSVEVSGMTSADDLSPLTSNVVAEPNPTNGATFVILTADVSDATTGNSDIATAEYFVGTVGADGSVTPMSASDGAFGSPTEGVTASIDVSGWSVGQYTLYVHGKDAAGNWGATESVVLEVTEESSNIMYVESIGFSSKVAGPNKFLYTTVKVVDGNEQPLGGVRVEMTLTHGTSSWDFAGDTGTDGTVKFTLAKAPSGDYTATVTNLILTDYTWDKTKGKILADHTL